MMDVVSVEKVPHDCEEGFTKDAPSVVKAPCQMRGDSC
jgi:hypothetical protein